MGADDRLCRVRCRLGNGEGVHRVGIWRRRLGIYRVLFRNRRCASGESSMPFRWTIHSPVKVSPHDAGCQYLVTLSAWEPPRQIPTEFGAMVSGTRASGAPPQFGLDAEILRFSQPGIPVGPFNFPNLNYTLMKVGVTKPLARVGPNKRRLRVPLCPERFPALRACLPQGSLLCRWVSFCAHNLQHARGFGEVTDQRRHDARQVAKVFPRQATK